MANGRPIISHVVISCFDFGKMLAYYTKILGFDLSDIGKIGDNDICFLTFDPQAEHHQLALTGGRRGQPGEGALNHVCFRLATYPDLQARFKMLSALGASGIRTTHHGSWLSVYSLDPEGNRIEFRWDMPWYCGQPYGKPLDLSLDEDAIKRATIEENRDNPRFQPIEAWRDKAEAKLVQG
ncbi:MAG TPA: VOC family protein [Stellaceae bacterium]|jgi:catechol-2,3-dioxygenase|nr:VOC family protein [Stellaceae bacterium]